MLNIQRGLNRLAFILIFVGLSFLSTYAQQTKMLQPQWWFGGSLGANFNFYSSDFKTLNSSIISPISFANGSGVGLFLSPLIEYRPDPVWGGMLFFGFDGRGGSFNDVKDSGITHSLSASMNYLSLEPCVRYSPLDYPLYFFAGPRIGFNVAKSFEYKRSTGFKKEDDFDHTRGTTLGIQLGAGYDIIVTKPEDEWQIIASPFLAIHFGQGPRSEESWALTTLRAGVAVKFGSTKEIKSKIEHEVKLSIRAPKIVPNTRTVKETFPMRNYIFFDQGTTQIPNRYLALTQDQAASFKEENLLRPEPKDLTGRSRRQMTVYHNILNVLGDRMRRYPNSTITLIGSSEQGQANGQAMANAVKDYIVSTFGIDGNKIKTEGRTKPSTPSVLPGATRELDMVVPEDRRVDVVGSSLELLEPVQIISLQEEPLDSDVLFTVDGAEDYFASWSIIVKSESGKTTRFGPFTSSQERVAGKSIIGEKLKDNYIVTLEGQTKDGQLVMKEETMKLIRSDEPEEAPGYRFSILFEFDQSKTVATYERFLTTSVAPLITDGSSVIIHGHTDIIGEESHNLKLSRDRAQQTMNVLEQSLAKSGKKRVKFDTYGFGEDVRRAPFENQLPEERFYNRTVIIDIVPE